MADKKVTKGILVESVYQKIAKCEKYVVQDVLDLLLVELREALESGATVELRGFGTFEPRLRKGRSKARNPKTGDMVSVAPHYVAVFRAGQALRKALWDFPVQ